MTQLLYQRVFKNLLELRQSIKKKRILLDESQELFGLVELEQFNEVKNEKDIKGYPFYGKDKRGNEFAIKIVPIEKKYNKNNHPAMLECIFLRELTDNIVNKNISPHIVHYLGYQKISNNAKAIRFLNLKKFEIEDVIRSNSNMLISEFVQGGSLDNWIYTTYENKEKITDIQWKVIIFQLLYTLVVLQKQYKMMHNDCHYGNILIDNTVKPGGYFIYKIDDKKYYIPNTGIIPKLWDFEFSMSYNNKITNNYINAYISNGEVDTDSADESNVPETYNEVYDTHYFLTSLLDLYISEELFSWIISLYPEELIPDDTDTTTTTTENSTTPISKLTLTEISSDSIEATTSTSIRQHILDGRLINGTEKNFKLPTPLELLNNPFFACFLNKPADVTVENSIIFELK